MLKILLIEDHELFRAGLKLLLADLAEDIEFTETSTASEALELVDKTAFDVVLMDFHVPGLHGLEALRALRARAEQPIIAVLSGEENPVLIRQVIDEGAAGFIPKASSHPVMIAALQLILAGGSYLPPSAVSSGPGATPSSSQDAAEASAHLTERQRTTLRLAMQGKANKVIARDMNISEATVKAHLSAAFRELGVHNRTEAVFVCARIGLVL